MQKIKDAIKICIIYILREILKIFWILPVKKKKIFFNSTEGKRFSCNPKYIFDYLYQNKKEDFEFIWCLNSPSESLEEYENIKTVKFLSLKFLMTLITCGVYITNMAVEPFIPKRKTQLFINTWHGGGAYKALSNFYRQRKSFKIMSRTRAKMTDVFLSSCAYYSKVSAFDWQAKYNQFYPFGTARNDILINKPYNSEKIVQIKEVLELPMFKKIVLYAPTVRGWAAHPDKFDFTIDIENLLMELNKKFKGDFLFLFRCHPSMLGKIKISENIKDVSNFEDMQELLLISDVLITDYSSSIWDFSFTGRPCFLFAPDLEEYKKCNNFYIPIEEWPYILTTSNEDLLKKIEEFDIETYNKAVEEHHKRLGSYETGHATERIAKIIINWIEGDNSILLQNRREN